MSFITVGDVLLVVSLNQYVTIYDLNGNCLYEGNNSTAPHEFDTAYVSSIWVPEDSNDLIIEADYSMED